MKYGIWALLLIFLSCNQEVKKPDHLISEGKMRRIIADIYVYRQTGQMVSGAVNIPYDQINMAILQKHEVSREQFQESYKYYVINNFAYGDMLKEVRDSLNGIIEVTQKNEDNKLIMPKQDPANKIPNEQKQFQKEDIQNMK